MKTLVRHFVSRFALTFLILLAALVWTVGCAGFVQHSDPLAKWHTASKDPDRSIINDYQNYIQTLSPEERKYMGPQEFFEDATAQHAIRIETDINGNQAWYHILIYDKDNKRIKVIKYYRGKYAS